MNSDAFEHMPSIDLDQPSEFTRAYNRYYARLCLFAYKTLSQEELVADLVNDVFVRLLQQGGCSKMSPI